MINYVEFLANNLDRTIKYSEHIAETLGAGGVSGVSGACGVSGVSGASGSVGVSNYNKNSSSCGLGGYESKTTKTLPILEDLELIPINSIKIQNSGLYGSLTNIAKLYE